jgi:hypothetical protein
MKDFFEEDDRDRDAKFFHAPEWYEVVEEPPPDLLHFGSIHKVGKNAYRCTINGQSVKFIKPRGQFEVYRDEMENSGIPHRYFCFAINAMRVLILNYIQNGNRK